MDLDELRAFLAVAEAGSMLAAAERLGLPRTTLRRRVESLEARIGSPLFFRGAQGAVLSPAGAAVAASGRRILAEASALLTSVRQIGDEAAGTMRVVLPIGLPPHVLVAIARICRERHPRLRFEVRFLEDPLAELGADLVAHFGERLTSGPWVTRTVQLLDEVLLASPAYLAARGTPTSIAELAGHDLHTWERPGADPHRLPTRGGEPVPIDPVVVTTDVHMLHQFAIAGGGLVFVPDALLPGDPDGGALVRVLPDVVHRACPLQVVVPEQLARAPQIRAVQQSILAFFG